MFKVKRKSDGSIQMVYAVSGGYFMVWSDADQAWKWEPIEDFVPVE